MNITLSIDEKIVKKVRKIAIDKDTTLTAMVRAYLTSLAQNDATTREAHTDKLMETFERLSRDMSPRTWTRENLYEERLGKYGR